MTLRYPGLTVVVLPVFVFVLDFLTSDQQSVVSPSVCLVDGLYRQRLLPEINIKIQTGDDNNGNFQVRFTRKNKNRI